MFHPARPGLDGLDTTHEIRHRANGSLAAYSSWTGSFIR